MFSESFRENLKHGKYSEWATDLTQEHLEALLWAVGEYGYRSHDVLEVLRQHTPGDPVAHARAVLALEILAEFVHGRPSNLDDHCERVSKVKRAWRESAR
jgi:hypothetical protein